MACCRQLSAFALANCLDVFRVAVSLDEGQYEVLGIRMRGTVVHKRHTLLDLHCSRNLKYLVTLVALVDMLTAFFILISFFVCSLILIVEVTCASKRRLTFN